MQAGSMERDQLRTVDVVQGDVRRSCQHCCHRCRPHSLTANADMAQAAQQRPAAARLKQRLTDGWHEAGACDAVVLNQRSHSLHVLQLLGRRHDYGAARSNAHPEVEHVHICKHTSMS